MSTTIKIGATQLNVTQLVAKGQLVLARLSTNPNFKDPQPELPALESALGDLEKSIVNAANGDRVHIAAMHVARKRVALIIRQLAHYVERVAAGDASLILSTGFELRKRATQKFTNASPQGLRTITTQQKKVVPLLWNPVRGARLYEIFLCEAEAPTDSQWQYFATSSGARLKAQVVKSAFYYWFRVRAIGRNGAGPWSDPIQALAL